MPPNRFRLPSVVRTCVAICLASGSTIAAALDDDNGHWYAQVSSGYAKPEIGNGSERNPDNANSEQQASLTEFPVNFEKGPVFDGAVGYAHETIRGELALTYFSTDIQDPEASTLGTDKVQSMLALANVWFRPVSLGSIRPYVGGGVGVIQRSISDDEDTATAAQLGVGLDWVFAGRWALTSGYRYVTTQRMNYSRGNRHLEFSYDSQSLSLGLRYMFGSTAKEMPPSVEVVPPDEPPP